MNMHNVKVRAYKDYGDMAAIFRKAQFGMLRWSPAAEVTRSFKCGEEERVSLGAILSTPARNRLIVLFCLAMDTDPPLTLNIKHEFICQSEERLLRS